MKSWPTMRRRQDSICGEFYFVEKCCSRGWTSLKVPGEGGINLVGRLEDDKQVVAISLIYPAG